MATTPANTPPPAGRWARWVRFLDRREPGTSLALFRIAAGCVVVGAVGSVVLHGLVPTVWHSRADGGFLQQLEPNWLFRLLGGAAPATVWAMTLTALASGALLALGLGGRITALVALQSYLAVTNLNPLCHGGDDILMGNALWLLVLARSTATLSLDCRIRTGRWVSCEPIPAWPRYLAIYQLVIMYWATGIQKISADWVPGGDLSALYYVFQQPSWIRYDMSWLAWVYPLTQVATLVSWLFEVSAPLLLLALWYRNTAGRRGRLRAFFNWIDFRRIYVAVGLTMHASLILLMNVEPFSWVTLSFYACLFRPEEWQSLGRRLFGTAVPEPQAAAPGKPWWPPLRAALVTFHLIAVSVMAFPAPPESATNPAEWEVASVKDEVSAWAERLRGLGIDTDAQELKDFLFGLSCDVVRIRRAVLRPFMPYYVYCGAYQSWRMFCAADHAPTRLHIDVEERGRWRTVAVERDANYPWLDGWLSHHRLRPPVYAFGEGAAEYEGFAAWVADQAARDFPEAAWVRVRYYKAPTPSPQEMRAGRRAEGRFVREKELKLR